jgi:uncharacterized membrane protein
MFSIYIKNAVALGRSVKNNIFWRIYHMINRAVLKSWAKDSLKNNWGIAIGSLLLYSLIAGVLSSIGVGSIFTGLIALGYIAVILSLVRTKTAKIETMFSAITENFGTRFVSTLLVFVYTFLWSLLFIIPGIVKSLSYSMTNFILLDRPELSATEAINESRRMMNGHKMELFVLELSFIGWILFAVVTFGIGSLYVTPYMNATIAAFYETLKSENSENASAAAASAEETENA